MAKIAAAAAREVDGVEDLRGGGMRRGWVRASDRGRGGAAGIRIEDGRASIDLRLVVRDGAAIPAVVDAVRARVTERVEHGTGLTVTKVDIRDRARPGARARDGGRPRGRGARRALLSRSGGQPEKR